ncbi:hypothetical protein DFS34DRAFT_596435 [Phlyctochytrium arcticum]|nr:hypothetical protein DFS34DRAFT_596435 [Phlyctochytrium arcticum]
MFLLLLLQVSTSQCLTDGRISQDGNDALQFHSAEPSGDSSGNLLLGLSYVFGSALACVLGAAVIFIQRIPFTDQKLSESRAFMALTMSTSAGTLLYTSLVELIPEALQNLERTKRLGRTAAGMLFLVLFLSGVAVTIGLNRAEDKVMLAELVMWINPGGQDCACHVSIPSKRPSIRSSITRPDDRFATNAGNPLSHGLLEGRTDRNYGSVRDEESGSQPISSTRSSTTNKPHISFTIPHSDNEIADDAPGGRKAIKFIRGRGSRRSIEASGGYEDNAHSNSAQKNMHSHVPGGPSHGDHGHPQKQHSHYAGGPSHGDHGHPQTQHSHYSVGPSHYDHDHPQKQHSHFPGGPSHGDHGDPYKSQSHSATVPSSVGSDSCNEDADSTIDHGPMDDDYDDSPNDTSSDELDSSEYTPLARSRMLQRRPSTRMYSVGLATAVSISLHKLPEGFILFTTTVLYNDKTTGSLIFIALALHNLTEGLAIALPIFLATSMPWKAFTLAAALAGFTQPLGAVIGWFVGCVGNSEVDMRCQPRGGAEPSLPDFPGVLGWEMLFGCLFSFVAGMMFWVSADGLLPAAWSVAGRHEDGDRHAGKRYVSMGLVIGIVIMSFCSSLMGE